MTEHATHLLICAATRWEADAVARALSPSRSVRVRGAGGGRVTLLRTGIGPARAAAAAAACLEHTPCDLVISTGFASALIPAAVGDLLIASETVEWPAPTPARSFPSPARWLTLARDAAAAAELPCHVGRLVSAARVMSTAVEKRRVAAQSGAVGLDMESLALAALASQRHLAFVAVRAVSDLEAEDLPLDFNLFLTPGRRLAAIGACLRPGVVGGVWRLHRQARRASAHLTRFFQRFLTAALQSADRGDERHRC